MSDLPDDLSPDSLAVHAGRGDLRALGVHALPLDLSTTYPFASLDGAVASLDAMMAGDDPTEGGPVYSRLHSPTVARFESGLAALEGTERAVAFSSGMAAITAAVLAAREASASGENGTGKNHVVGVKPIYGTTDKLLSSGTLGLEVTWTDASGVRDAVREDTCLVCVETPVNPTLELVDLEDIVRQASGVPVMCDSTFATPVLQRPAAHGVAMVVHSGTKFIGGHGDVLAGVVACSREWAAKLREVRILTGANLHPMAAYMLHRGLPTLPLRVRRSQETATDLAARLLAHEAVSNVYHPSVPGRDPHGLVGRQMDGPGPMLSFEVAGFVEADRLMRALRVITPAVSLGSTDTLIQHPAGLTQRVASGEGGAITPGLLRLAVGLEDAEDLWRDLLRGLDG
ncbi:trans-sulfuration enzyme family protein [Rubricoccus marinus]|uniref:Cystathionine gamma-synthase n=1 Tax=Rubricoccus marinus TaxID=716817 RepID=A0A259U3B8_9BACT|nr:PLP-dependent aspartate aminotransferase family protein [Rubricoccus marinus]OZC04304.1 cystathionine gamma-synthase [Rubricoccus marinus]